MTLCNVYDLFRRMSLAGHWTKQHVLSREHQNAMGNDTRMPVHYQVPATKIVVFKRMVSLMISWLLLARMHWILLIPSMLARKHLKSILALDPRFEDMFSSHLYALDPTNPQYNRGVPPSWENNLGRRVRMQAHWTMSKYMNHIV